MDFVKENADSARLAYLGDAVWEVLVRRRLVAVGDPQPAETALGYVTAQAQSDAVERILPHLTEEEEAVYRRGRNCVHANVPRHATVIQYRRATGLELTGARERMAELFDFAYIEDGTTDQAASAEP